MHEPASSTSTVHRPYTADAKQKQARTSVSYNKSPSAKSCTYTACVRLQCAASPEKSHDVVNETSQTALRTFSLTISHYVINM